MNINKIISPPQRHDDITEVTDYRLQNYWGAVISDSSVVNNNDQRLMNNNGAITCNLSPVTCSHLRFNSGSQGGQTVNGYKPLIVLYTVSQRRCQWHQALKDDPQPQV